MLDCVSSFICFWTFFSECGPGVSIFLRDVLMCLIPAVQKLKRKEKDVPFYYKKGKERVKIPVRIIKMVYVLLVFYVKARTELPLINRGKLLKLCGPIALVDSKFYADIKELLDLCYEIHMGGLIPQNIFLTWSLSGKVFSRLKGWLNNSRLRDVDPFQLKLREGEIDLPVDWINRKNSLAVYLLMCEALWGPSFKAWGRYGFNRETLKISVKRKCNIYYKNSIGFLKWEYMEHMRANLRIMELIIYRSKKDRLSPNWWLVFVKMEYKMKDEAWFDAVERVVCKILRYPSLLSYIINSDSLTSHPDLDSLEKIALEFIKSKTLQLGSEVEICENKIIKVPQPFKSREKARFNDSFIMTRVEGALYFIHVPSHVKLSEPLLIIANFTKLETLNAIRFNSYLLSPFPICPNLKVLEGFREKGYKVDSLLARVHSEGHKTLYEIRSVRTREKLIERLEKIKQEKKFFLSLPLTLGKVWNENMKYYYTLTFINRARFQYKRRLKGQISNRPISGV